MDGGSTGMAQRLYTTGRKKEGGKERSNLQGAGEREKQNRKLMEKLRNRLKEEEESEGNREGSEDRSKEVKEQREKSKKRKMTTQVQGDIVDANHPK